MMINQDHETGHVTISVALQRIAIGVAGAAIMGAGALLFSTGSSVRVHEQRITYLEEHLDKLPEIDKNVVVLSGKIDVMNQKLDDAKLLAAAKK